MSKRLAVLALASTIAAGTASAQIPATTDVAMSSFANSLGNAAIYFEDIGGVCTIRGTTPLVGGGTGSDSIETGVNNMDLYVFDTSGYYVIPPAGPSTFIPLAGGSMQWGCLGESNELYTCTSTGQVWRHDLSGTISTLFATPGGLLNAICWDGTTGGLAVCEFGGSGNMYKISAAGVITTFISGITSMSGCDWNPWDGSILVSRFGGGSTPGIVRISSVGTATSLGVVGPPTATNNSVEVDENPAERYLCSELGGAPDHLTYTSPAGITTVCDMSSAYGPSDACFYRDRQVWGNGTPWKPGQAAGLAVNFPLSGGLNYQLAVSLSGHTPGVPLGQAGTLHLVPDSFFLVSAQNLLPSLFVNFAGTLDATGSPTQPVFVNIPNIPIQTRVWVGGAAYNAAGINEVSNCYGAMIQ